ncbi:hypothetical protein QOZ80_4AG0314220 [Eleusine coracana subsp. coracana]|nr:hypothetical protein QOZ80_4AG0314220 [Eleusine coracana subsp. coracana]
MGDDNAAGHGQFGGAASSSSPRAEAHLPAGSEDEDYNELYGDVDVGFVPLPPPSPSPSPSSWSQPKTPSPGPTPFPSSPPHRASPSGRRSEPPPSPSPPPSSWPQPKTPSPGPGFTPFPSPPPRRSPSPEPRPEPSAAQYQPPRPPPPPAAPRHQMTPPQREPRGSSSSSPPGRRLYISELHWWTTDAEVEAALALVPDAAPELSDLYFFSDKITGKSRGVCRAEFRTCAAAAAAAAALNGRDFNGRNCVASLSRPPTLNRLSDDFDAETPVRAAPNPSRGRGGSSAAQIRGNVGQIMGDRPALAPLPQQSMALRPHGLPFRGGGYGGFAAPPLGQFNPGMGAGMIPQAVAPHMNSAFLAACGMAMHGPGMWHDQVMGGDIWRAPPWNFRGCQLPLRQPPPTMQEQQQHAEGGYGKGQGMRRGRPGRSDETGIGNVRSFPARRQSDHDGGDLYKERDREERSQRRERSPENEREPERHRDEGDQRRGNRRRYHEYDEDDDDDDRRMWAKARSQSRNDGYDDHPRKRR